MVSLSLLTLIVVFTAGCTDTTYKPYMPRSVTFQIVDQRNVPIPNVTISYRDPYITDIFLGYTDENGTTEFMMDGSMQYNITVFNPENGGTRSYSVFPTNSYYCLTLTPQTPAHTPTDTTISPSLSLNSMYWIAVDPIPDHYPNDLINVTGSTNLPQNDELTIEVFNYVFSPGCGGPHTICNDAYFSNTSQIPLNASGNNTFAFTVNTSGFYQSKFRVRVIPARYDVMGESAFTLK